jgi:multidrug efflux pump subunit AcrB
VLAALGTTSLGFVPQLLFDGGDFKSPLAVVIVAGMAGSTAIALVLTPVVYTRFVARPAVVRPAPTAARAGRAVSELVLAR